MRVSSSVCASLQPVRGATRFNALTTEHLCCNYKDVMILLTCFYYKLFRSDEGRQLNAAETLTKNKLHFNSREELLFIFTYLVWGISDMLR